MSHQGSNVGVNVGGYGYNTGTGFSGPESGQTGVSAIDNPWSSGGNQVGTSPGTFLKNYYHSLTHLSDFTPSGPPDPSAPPAPPTPGQANIAAVNGQLSQEQKMYASNTLLAGTSGLLDEPKTASRTLMGS